MDPFRARKKKGPSLLEDLKEMKMLEEGETVEVEAIDYEDLIEENAKSVVVRCLNIQAHKVGALIKALPPIWGIDDRVLGRGVGEDRAQFHFDSEGDLYHVLHRGPWFVNGWIVSIEQWKANPDSEYLKRILFWVRVKGIPVHLLKKQVVESIVRNMGKVDVIELHAKNSNSVEYVRARIWINTEEPLQFLKTVSFKHGEKIQVEFTYEKLLKICYNCKRVTHDIQACPFNIKVPENRRSDRSDRGATGFYGKHSEAQLKGKGKGFKGLEKSEVSGLGAHTADFRSGMRNQRSTSKSPFERLQWTKLGKKRSGRGFETEWRAKDTRSLQNTEEETSKSTEDSGLLVYRSRKRKLSDSEDRLGKKQRTLSSGEKSKSPSVFARVGDSGEKGREMGGGSGSGCGSGSKFSNEKKKASPSVFERLGSQASSSSPKVKSGNSDHSVHVAAQLSNHSASSEAAQCSRSPGSLSARRNSSNMKEGLMVNSNPSNHQ